MFGHALLLMEAFAIVLRGRTPRLFSTLFKSEDPQDVIWRVAEGVRVPTHLAVPRV